jgi:hypothetical protein
LEEKMVQEEGWDNLVGLEEILTELLVLQADLVIVEEEVEG